MKTWLLLLMLIGGLSACQDSPIPTLSKEDKEAIDTLYLAELQTLRPYLDSLCELNFDSLVKIAADSMLIERIEEIEEQRNRYRNEK